MGKSHRQWRGHSMLYDALLLMSSTLCVGVDELVSYVLQDS